MSAGTTALERIEGVMAKAAAALSRSAWFEAERLALKALTMAREESSAKGFDAMARIALPLQEARRQRVQQAIDIGVVSIWEGPVTEDVKVAPGCWLIEPPLVGADARRLRIAALQSETPAILLCREPKTQMGLWPMVAIGGGASVRARIRPPRDPQQPDMAWFVGAMEALGDEALESIDPAMEPVRRLDALLHRLDIVPEHEKLHQAIVDACRTCCDNGHAQKPAMRVRKPAARPKSTGGVVPER
jgi:hypothetical protein